MRGFGFGLQQRLAVGVVSVGFLLASGASAAHAGTCPTYDPYLDALKSGRCAQAQLKQERHLQVVPSTPQRHGTGTYSTRAL
jgi:hypothetical protein